MENKNSKILAYIFVCMVGFGIGLIVVSLFIGVVKIKVNMSMAGAYGAVSSQQLTLFDDDWEMLGVSPAFMIISFLVLLIGLAMVAVDASVRQKFNKKTKGLNYIALAISAIGFILLIVSAIYTKDKVEDGMNNWLLAYLKLQMAETDTYVTDQQLMLIIKMMISYKLGIGSVMAIIGGVIALLGSVLLAIPALDPLKTAKPAATQPTGLASVQPFAVNPSNTPASADNTTQPSGLSSVRPFAAEPETTVNTNTTDTNNNNDTIA
ncbi:MAG: hypothetical protein J1F69_01360 [Clostridiales bacterium]|nr:hypothetical protein [Clostridiales bacterium]